MNDGETGIRLEGVDDARLRTGRSSDIREVDRSLGAIHDLFAMEASLAPNTLAQYGRAWTRSHLQDGDIKQVVDLANRARDEFAALVTLGIGGSDLSARVFHDVLDPPYHNLLPADERGGAPEVYFTGDTFDPRRLGALLDMLTRRGMLHRTLFNVISKSGRTGETVSALMVVRDRLSRQAVKDWHGHIVATTGPDARSALSQSHPERPFYGDALLPVPEGVGGRFSAFSPVGTFFLAMTAGTGMSPGSRVREMLEGVRWAEARWRLPWPDERNIACRLARWLHLQERYGRKQALVFYNYADNRRLGDWFQQLYDESLQERGGGLHVVPAVGPAGNHSVLNGIVGGRADRVVLFIHWENLGRDLKIPDGAEIGGEMAAFGGLRMGEAQSASYLGTARDFSARGIPNATLHVVRRDERHLGALMRVLMDTVAVKGRLQGQHVNVDGDVDPAADLTYAQDGVEGYKQRTRDLALQMKSTR
ncbi:MAG: hypothetical protein OXR72_14505 [Gemmatimonadota bacterium]|nr:hypothetical protein [Gemmatimonadota bacterium]